MLSKLQNIDIIDIYRFRERELNLYLNLSKALKFEIFTNFMVNYKTY